MTNRLIHSTQIRAKSPIRSAIFSLIIIGMGQLYMGQLSQAVAYMLIRSTIIIIPAFLTSLSWKYGFPIDFVFIAAILLAAVTILSPIAAFKNTNCHRENYPLSNYSLKHYIIFIIINISLTALSIFLFYNSFTFIRLQKPSPPIFEKGDIVLIYKMKTHEKVEISKMFLEDSGDILRVSLMGKGKIIMQKSQILINGIKQELSIPNEEKLKKMKLSTYDILLYKSGKLFFPIITPISNKKFRAITKKDETLLLSDDRRNEFIHQKRKTDDLKYRVEGIIIRPDVFPSWPITTLFK